MHTTGQNHIKLDQRALERLDQAIKIVKAWADGHVIEICIFGSYAKGEQRKYSSIDLLIVLDESNERFIHRKANLERILNEDDIFPLVDPLVYTESEVLELINKKESFMDSVLNECIVFWNPGYNVDLDTLSPENAFPSKYRGASPQLESLMD